jgi:glycosyltransferase involved in cell wall biosynthesis
MFVIHNPAFGGGHNEILQQRAGLEAAGWELLFVTGTEPSTGAERLAEAGIEVVQTPLHRLRATRRLDPHLKLARGLVPEVRSLRELIRSRDVDLVQPHGETNAHGALAARLEGAAVCWHLYDTASPLVLRRAMRPVVSRLAGSVTVTGEATLHAYPGLERSADRVVVTFPPVDTRRFRPDPGRREAARVELKLREGEVAIGTVGNRNPRKGHDLLIEAASALVRRRPGARTLIMGGPSPAHAQYEASLHASIERHGLGDAVRIIDPGTRVAELLPALDIFVLPSHPGEGMPTVILEAMSCRLPVVATDVAAVTEEVEEGTTGFVVPPRDPARLVDALERLIDDEELRDQMGAAGQARVNELFTPERAVANRLRAWEIALSVAGRR